jgi:hypothetical protein
MRDRSIVLAAAAALVACAEAQPCPGNLEVCGGACVDTSQNVEHCGSCGTACLPGGEVCLDGECLPVAEAPCDKRAGGAYVLLGTCGQSLKAWIADPVFIEVAEDLAAGIDVATPYPVLTVRDGTDCDGQWTWHADPVDARFEEAAAVGCAGCPADVEAAKSSRIGGAWCPGSGPEPVEFLLVERRD